jgi:catechol 2,3-dioxygenase-like lactoylglutathione lyase family enzyme
MKVFSGAGYAPSVRQRETIQRLGEFMKSSRDVLIQTKKMDAAARFYENILGFRIFERSERLIGFETGSFRFFVDKGEPYGPVFEFYVSDLKQAKKALIENGCRIEAEDSTVPRCYVRDPFGLIFNLAEKKDSK